MITNNIFFCKTGTSKHPNSSAITGLRSIVYAIFILLFLCTPGIANTTKNIDSITFDLKRSWSLQKQLELVGITKDDADSAVEELENVYDIKKLTVGHRVKVNFEIMDTEGKEIRFSSMEIRLTHTSKIQVSRLDNDIFFAHVFESGIQPKLMYIYATVGSTLFSAAMNAGISHEMFNEFVKAYSYDVDFQRDVSPGDKIEVLYEAVYDDDGKLVSDGEILYISLSIKRGKFTLYNYTTPDGKSDYYTHDGQIAQKSLLRTPVNGARISSGYGKRKHPILGYSKIHKGIDFAAPKGTPVYAAGDGIIKEIRSKGSYGRYIKIFHNNIYTTAYAHLNSFAKNLKRGSAVTQGQVIGYVGSTGRSTGPHLHYEVLEKGKPTNPLLISMSFGKEIDGDEKALFIQYRDSLLGNVARMAKKSLTPEKRS